MRSSAMHTRDGTYGALFRLLELIGAPAYSCARAVAATHGFAVGTSSRTIRSTSNVCRESVRSCSETCIWRVL